MLYKKPIGGKKMKKLLHGTDYNYLITSNMVEREFIYYNDLTDKEKNDNDQYTDEDLFINNGGLTALSEIIIYDGCINNGVSDYLNSLGEYDGLVILPSMCSVYEIMAINISCDGYTIFSIKTTKKD